jgi:hypothetical protein
MSAAEEERRRLGLSRRLAFQNLANGVPPEKIAADLKLSLVEIEQAHRFVAKKIAEYLVLRRQPPCFCDDLRSLRWNRKRALAVLSKIGDLDLSTELILSRVTVQKLDHPEMLDGAKHRMTEAYR